MHTIHKYGLQTDDIIHLPYNAEVIHFAIQEEVFRVWVRVDTQNKTHQSRRLRIIGTGHEFDANAKYLGTVHDRGHVWHLIEE